MGELDPEPEVPAKESRLPPMAMLPKSFDSLRCVHGCAVIPFRPQSFEIGKSIPFLCKTYTVALLL